MKSFVTVLFYLFITVYTVFCTYFWYLNDGIFGLLLALALEPVAVLVASGIFIYQNPVLFIPIFILVGLLGWYVTNDK